MGVAATTEEPGRADDSALLERYAATRDPQLRAVLVERFLPLVRHLARKYAHGSEPLEDLVQVGSIGLLNAIDRYDPASGYAFSSFAVPTIVGEIKRHYRDRSWSVRPPRGLQELSLRVRPTEDRLERRLGRIPTANELAAELDVDVEELLNARVAASGQAALSLDQTMSTSDGDGQTLLDTLETDEPGFGLVEDGQMLSTLMACLDDRSREILRQRYAEDLTQTEIAERVGVSQMHVSRLLRDALARMHALHRRLAAAPRDVAP